MARSGPLHTALYRAPGLLSSGAFSRHYLLVTCPPFNSCLGAGSPGTSCALEAGV
jgi:hypothetical protein